MNTTKIYINKRYIKDQEFQLKDFSKLIVEIRQKEYDDSTWAIEDWNQQKHSEKYNVKICEIMKCINHMEVKILQIQKDSYMKFVSMKNGIYTFYCEYQKELKKFTKNDVNELWEKC